MRTKTPLLLLLAALLAFSSACSRRSKAPDLARGDKAALKAATAPVNILDRDLRNKVAADIATTERLPDGRLSVRANLRNSTTKPLKVEARMVFKDSAGVGVGDATEWETLFFAPQQIQTLVDTSHDHRAMVFTIEVRKP